MSITKNFYSMRTILNMKNIGLVSSLCSSLFMVTGCHTNTSSEMHKTALVNIELGLNYLAKGEYTRAKTKLTHALALCPNAFETHSAMAYFLEKVGESCEAENEHKKAIKCSHKMLKENGAVYNNYGTFLCRQGRFKEADRTFNKALKDKDYPNTAEIYENAGISALKSQQHEKAKNYLHKAMQHNPKQKQAILELMSRIPNFKTPDEVSS